MSQKCLLHPRHPRHRGTCGTRGSYAALFPWRPFASRCVVSHLKREAAFCWGQGSQPAQDGAAPRASAHDARYDVVSGPGIARLLMP